MKEKQEAKPRSESAESPRPAPQNLRDRILEESRKGNVVFTSFEGLAVAPLDEFIKQPADGILYDLNRLPEVVMTFLDDPKWVNDFAVSMVIKRLREQVESAVQSELKRATLSESPSSLKTAS